MRILQIVLLGGGLAAGGLAWAEQPAPDRTCQCSCGEKPVPTTMRRVPGHRTDIDPNDIERTSGVDAEGVDVQPPVTLPPRKITPVDPGRPHIFDTPGLYSPAEPGLPTTTPWHD